MSDLSQIADAFVTGSIEILAEWLKYLDDPVDDHGHGAQEQGVWASLNDIARPEYKGLAAAIAVAVRGDAGGDEKSAPLAYWRRKLLDMRNPELTRRLVQALLSVQPSSAPSERLFSSVAHIARGRDMMEPGKLEMLTAIREYIRRQALTPETFCKEVQGLAEKIKSFEI